MGKMQLEDELKELSGLIDIIRSTISRVVMGQEKLLEGLLICVVAGEHALIEGVPGVGKTSLIKALASCLDLSFKRIQFTPDMMPSDITGLRFFHQPTGEFRFKQGPVFANIVLADEVNRAPPKVQSALLEAMQERQVTVDGDPYRLPEPFMVFATLNPVEYEGTYPLPEAELDRFMIKLSAGYPDSRVERYIIQSYPNDGLEDLWKVMGKEQVLKIQRIVRNIEPDEEAVNLVMKITIRSRSHPDVRLGLSTRGAAHLMVAAKSRAFLEGSSVVKVSHVKWASPYVLHHKIILKPESSIDVTVNEVIKELLE